MDARRMVERVAFGGLPCIVALTTIVVSARDRVFAIDFHTVTPEIRGLAHGANPYVTDHLADGGHFLWPILTGLLLLPVASLPFSLGDVAFTIAQVACLGWALRLLGVRDWRVYGIVLAWPATVNSIQTANITLPVCLLLALAWRHRGRTRCGLWAGLAVGVKLLGWPVLVWLVSTRRWKALALALGVQIAGVLVIVPYVPLAEYVTFERTVAHVFGPSSLTLTALLEDGGLGHRVAFAVTITAGLAVLAAGRNDLDLCIAAALILTPVAWLHYFDLLLVPLALWKPPLWVWAIPFLLVVTPGDSNGEPWQTAMTLGACAATVVLARVMRTDDDVHVVAPAQVLARV